MTEYQKDVDDEKTRHLDTTEYMELIEETKRKAENKSCETSDHGDQGTKMGFLSKVLKKFS